MNMNHHNVTTPSLTLFELNSLIRQTLQLTLDESYWVEAEVSEARLASNGHFYVEFMQSDAFGGGMVAKARGTMWARTYSRLMPSFEQTTGERVKAGMKVRVLVEVVFHELYGYSLNIIDIDPAFTLGSLAQRRREILQKLEADGILEDNRQLPLPMLLQRIAVVSSATAAGYGDFCKQLEQNAAGLAFKVKLFPAVMQGQNVEQSVMAALEAICAEHEEWDCVVMIRGGGATSDLSDFDSYPLAAAVAQMPLPVIVGIGHERDTTVLDFVAHTALKTPTAVAAFLLEHQLEQLKRVEDVALSIERVVGELMLRQHSRLDLVSRSLPQVVRLRMEREHNHVERMAQSLPHIVSMRAERESGRLTRLEQQIGMLWPNMLKQADLRLQLVEQRCKALDPQVQLNRGYSLTYHNGQLLRNPATLKSGDKIVTRLAEGEVHSVCTR